MKQYQNTESNSTVKLLLAVIFSGVIVILLQFIIPKKTWEIISIIWFCLSFFAIYSKNKYDKAKERNKYRIK